VRIGITELYTALAQDYGMKLTIFTQLSQKIVINNIIVYYGNGVTPDLTIKTHY